MEFVTIILIIPLLAVSFCVHAQPPIDIGNIDPVRKGSVTSNLGFGTGNDYKGDYYNSGFGIKIAAEWGLWRAGPGVITLGGEIGGSFSSGGHYYNYTSRTEVVAARSAWHNGWEVQGLDTYGGFSGGFGLHHFEYDNTIGHDGTQAVPVFGVFAGVSYFIAPKFGFNVEARYDITKIQAGIIFKLR